MNKEKKKTSKELSPRGFLNKTNTKAAASAAAFISQYRDWLVSGEIAPLTSPILAKLDAGDILPTPCLKEIQNAVLGHIIAVDLHKAEKSMETPLPGTQKNFLCMILDENNVICTRTKENGEEENLVKGFDSEMDGGRWLDRRLYEGKPTWHGQLEDTRSSYAKIVLRDDSIARLLKHKKGPAVYRKGVSTKTLGWQPKCKQDRATFSKG